MLYETSHGVPYTPPPPIAARDGGVNFLWKPSGEVKVTGFGAADFELTRDTAAVMQPSELLSGELLLESLCDEERALVSKRVHARNPFDELNRNSSIFIEVVKIMVKPGLRRSADEVSADVQDPQIFDKWGAPFGGIQIIKVDEDRGKPGRLATFGKMLVFAATKRFAWDEANEELLWFESPMEAVAAMDASFGPYLPSQFARWDDLGSDEGMADLCVSGVGGWYLTASKPTEEAGHEVPEGSAMECNLEYLSAYETRPTWIRYGHTAYLGPPPDQNSSLPGPLLGVWSCHHQKLLRPGDDLWEHAKMGFRSTLGMSLTCRDHLAWLHWIKANGLHNAARETLAADHPVRRLLKQHYYGTGEINFSSKDMLLPLGQFAHRTFGLTDDGWISYFSDVVRDFKYESLRENIEKRNLPESFTKHWPVAADGLRLWDVMKDYIGGYLLIFYPEGDAQVATDSDLIRFWDHFEHQIDAGWRLPDLTFDSLATLLTDLVWWVTAGHEFVGSIVEYLTPPNGLPSKIMDGKTAVDVQSYAQALVIIALTGIGQPALMSDWTHLFKVPAWPSDQQQAVLDIVRKFQEDLASCADEVDRLNFELETRGERKFVAFNPRILETSVSI